MKLICVEISANLVVVLLFTYLVESQNLDGTGPSRQRNADELKSQVAAKFERIREILKTDKTQNPGSNHKAKWEPILQKYRQDMQLRKEKYENDPGFGDFFDWAFCEIDQMIAGLCETTASKSISSCIKMDSSTHKNTSKSSGVTCRVSHKWTDISVVLLTVTIRLLF